MQELFNIPENYVLVAQMPFGGIVAEREAKAEEDISKRVRFIKQIIIKSYDFHVVALLFCNLMLK